MIGVFHDKKNKRLFLLFYPDLPGVINLKINNKTIKLSTLKKVGVVFSGTNKDEHGKLVSDNVNLGFWIPFKNDNFIKIEGQVDWPNTFSYIIDHEPNRKASHKPGQKIGNVNKNPWQMTIERK